MTELVACLSSGKGTWGHVARLIKEGKWDKTFILTNEFGRQNFKAEANVEVLLIDEEKGIKELRDDIYNFLKDKIKGFEVGVNIISGSGKEHLALMSALLKMGVGMRFVALTKDGAEEI